jgi:MbtH protein
MAYPSIPARQDQRHPKEKGSAMGAAEMSYRVIVNDDEQYSSRTVGTATPRGWRNGGLVGSEQDCLARIAWVWSDPRPRALRIFERDPAASTSRST